MDSLLNTPEKQANAVMQFESLQSHPGWQLVVAIVRANIGELERQLKEGVAGQTIEDVNRLRDKIKDHENFINTPENLMKEYSQEESTEPNDDPF
jgi:CHAD domain-containing protein